MGSLLTILFTNGSQTNVDIAAQKLKLCVKTLEGEEKFSNFADGSQIEEEKAWSETPAPKMDALIALMETASSHSSEETKKIVKALLIHAQMRDGPLQRLKIKRPEKMLQRCWQSLLHESRPL